MAEYEARHLRSTSADEASANEVSQDPEPEPANDDKKSGGLGVGWVLLTIVLAFVLAFLLRAFVIGTYVVPSGSMLETIQEGDLLLGQKVTLYFSDPEAGDIVTFISPEDNETTLIKRVIATEGQTIDLIDGVVYVDGEALDEDYTLGKETYSLSDLTGSVGITYPYTVPEGYIFVMGDNRTNSKDSRYFGAVSVDSVTSIAVFIYWPPEDWGLL